jgi:hypothetical protein
MVLPNTSDRTKAKIARDIEQADGALEKVSSTASASMTVLHQFRPYHMHSSVFACTKIGSPETRISSEV